MPAFKVKVISRSKYEGTLGSLVKAVDDYASRQLTDPFDTQYALGAGPAQGYGGDFLLIAPPFNPAELMRLPTQSNVLLQCMDAMATNIEGFGHTLEYTGKSEDAESPEVLAEKERLEALLSQPNPDDSLIDLRKKVRLDLETVGWACLEVGRDIDNGETLWFTHVPSATCRLTKRDIQPTFVNAWLKRDGEYKVTKVQKRFRRIVQLRGVNRVYFREFGDPRHIDPKTGKENPALGADEVATEIIWIGRYTPGETYSLPRWINQLPSIIGSRESELVNLQFFKDNAIPAMAILVSGGILPAETIDDVRKAFSKKGLDAMNRVLIIEATSDPNSGGLEGDAAVPRLTMQPMAQERQGDALFQEYDKNNMEKVQSSFRLPPIIVGRSLDYNRSTAEAALDMAESQVFAPERTSIDSVFNNKLLLDGIGKPPQFWRMRSNPAKLSSSEAVVDAMGKFNSVGAMTPNIAISIANEIFGFKLKPIEEAWGDLPFELTQAEVLAEVQAKVPADANGAINTPLKAPSALASKGASAPPAALTRKKPDTNLTPPATGAGRKAPPKTQKIVQTKVTARDRVRSK